MLACRRDQDPTQVGQHQVPPNSSRSILGHGHTAEGARAEAWLSHPASCSAFFPRPPMLQLTPIIVPVQTPKLGGRYQRQRTHTFPAHASSGLVTHWYLHGSWAMVPIVVGGVGNLVCVRFPLLLPLKQPDNLQGTSSCHPCRFDGRCASSFFFYSQLLISRYYKYINPSPAGIRGKKHSYSTLHIGLGDSRGLG